MVGDKCVLKIHECVTCADAKSAVQVQKAAILALVAIFRHANHSLNAMPEVCKSYRLSSDPA